MMISVSLFPASISPTIRAKTDFDRLSGLDWIGIKDSLANITECAFIEVPHA
jgi:hypothetical protein